MVGLGSLPRSLSTGHTEGVTNGSISPCPLPASLHHLTLLPHPSRDCQPHQEEDRARMSALGVAGGLQTLPPTPSSQREG